MSYLFPWQWILKQFGGQEMLGIVWLGAAFSVSNLANQAASDDAGLKQLPPKPGACLWSNRTYPRDLDHEPDAVDSPLAVEHVLQFQRIRQQSAEAEGTEAAVQNIEEPQFGGTETSNLQQVQQQAPVYEEALAAQQAIAPDESDQSAEEASSVTTNDTSSEQREHDLAGERENEPANFWQALRVHAWDISFLTAILIIGVILHLLLSAK